MTTWCAGWPRACFCVFAEQIKVSEQDFEAFEFRNGTCLANTGSNKAITLMARLALNAQVDPNVNAQVDPNVF